MTLEELFDISYDQKPLRTFVDCYRQSQGKHSLGIQEDLPMRSLAPLMANIVLMEAQTPSEIYYRIVGQNVVDRLGFNPTGLNLINLLAPAFAEQLPQLHQAMMKHPCGYYAVYENEYDSGRTMITESLVLPMTKASDNQASMTLALHSHVGITGVTQSSGETTLATRLDRGALVDIGFGIPEGDFDSDILTDLTQAVSH